jgi:hypothetical protein
MIRKLNFTDRKKIPLNYAMVTLLNTNKRHYSFDINFDLSEFDFPIDSFIYVEAYKRTSYMRFDYGTVGNPKVPTSRSLEKIEAGAIPLFRLKIVDKKTQQGRIIAMADKIHPIGTDNSNKNIVSLLHVEFSEDLGSQVWRLDLTGGWPVVQVNSQVAAMKEIAKSDTGFVALVYPEIIRQVLTEIIDSEQLDPEVDEDEWSSLWIKFATSLPSVGSPPTERSPNIKNDQRDWIERAVCGFCERWNILKNFQDLHTEE